jgi:hypothetical protein
MQLKPMEDGKIDKDGFLEIKRGNTYKTQMCPFNTDIVTNEDGGFVKNMAPGGASCGDWCPQFGEPAIELIGNMRDGVMTTIDGDGVTLPICQGRILVFNKFTDERPT